MKESAYGMNQSTTDITLSGSKRHPFMDGMMKNPLAITGRLWQWIGMMALLTTISTLTSMSPRSAYTPPFSQ